MTQSVKNLLEVLDSKDPIGWTSLGPIEVGHRHMKIEDMRDAVMRIEPIIDAFLILDMCPSRS